MTGVTMKWVTSLRPARSRPAATSRLAMTFDARWDDEVAADPPSRITWEIEPAGDGLSKLTVVHDGFAGETNTYGQVGGGMPYILSGLKTLLETGQPLAVAGVTA